MGLLQEALVDSDVVDVQMIAEGASEEDIEMHPARLTKQGDF